MEFVKGHGTENDFVVLPDPDGELTLTDDLVRALCHRRRGLGADGVLRVVRVDTPVADAALAGFRTDDAVWFMDYRNADGSLAEMCGNGIRVFARYLVDAGLVAPGTHTIATRAGRRSVEVGASGDVRVDMGPARIGPRSTAIVGVLGGLGVLGRRSVEGVAVDVGNPHLACVVGDLDETGVDALDLRHEPLHDPELFPRGVNVEVLTPLVGDRTHLRVHERGSGETRSCGTGTVAGAVAALAHDGRDAGAVTVDTPGGVLRVTVDANTTTLTGPAELVAHGQWNSAIPIAPVGSASW